MMDDPIVKKVRDIREEHARKFDNDLDRIFDDLKDKETKSSRKIVSMKPRRPREAAGKRKS